MFALGQYLKKKIIFFNTIFIDTLRKITLLTTKFDQVVTKISFGDGGLKFEKLYALSRLFHSF